MAETLAPDTKPALDQESEDPAFRVIRDALRGLQFGAVTAIVQDGVVVQVERTDKKRIPRKRQAN